MKSIENISARLVQTLQDRGLAIDNENGEVNAIIISLSEAYNLGVEAGIRTGKIKILESMEEEIGALKDDIVKEIKSER